MADLPSPQCGCGCRPRTATADGCPCRECQPGPGINFLKGFHRQAARNAELIAADRYEDVRWVYVKEL